MFITSEMQQPPSSPSAVTSNLVENFQQPEACDMFLLKRNTQPISHNPSSMGLEKALFCI